MKTKKYIIFTLVAFITGVLTVITSSVYASTGGGGSGPGCYTCECYGTCDTTTTSGTWPPTSGTWPPTSGTYTTNIIDPPISTSGTYTTNIIDPPISTSGTNLTNDILVTCLPKKFTKLPDKTDSVSLSGLCAGGVFIYGQNFPNKVGNKTQMAFEGLCTNGISTTICTYLVGEATCPDQTFTCPDGTKVTPDDNTCAFPSCKEDPKCPAQTFTCPDGTVLNNYLSNGKCVFPSCPDNKECNADIYTCPNGDIVKRSGDACLFPACPDIDCGTEKFRCEDGTEIQKSKINGVCAFPSCPAVNDLYSISGIVKVDDKATDSVTVQIYRIDDTDFSNPIKGSQTSSDGSYLISGLTPGEYIVKPIASDVYAFLSVQSVKIQRSNLKDRNFNGLYKKNITNPIITTVFKEGVTTGSDATTNGSLTSWLDDLTGTGNKKNISTSGTTTTDSGTGTSGGDTGTGGNGTSSTSSSSLTGELSSIDTAYANVFTFTGNSLISILEKGYTLENQSYSPVSLSLISRYANQNSICGNGKIEEGETCDDGRDNGKRGFCSPDCLYRGEIRFSDEGIQSNATGYKRSNGAGFVQKIGQWSSNAAQKISTFKVLSKNIVGDSYNKISRLSADTVTIAKDMIVSNTSPRTRKILKQVAVVTEEVAKYSVIGVASLLGVAAASLNVMVFKSQWKSYTIQEGDTFDTIGSKFNMTERALRRRNGIDKKKALKPGTKIKVRNRAFIEKDYLNQLQSVLTDALKTRNHGHMAEKIEKMFAKK